MKQYILAFIIIGTFISGCRFHPKIVRHPFPLMPNIDSLDKANELVGKYYYLTDSLLNADINHFKLEHFDSLSLVNENNKNLKYIFKPIAGNFTVYQFIASFNGLAYGNIIRPFHDFLILKTDSSHSIIEAYQYTVEWGEQPYSVDLFRLSKKNIKLIDNLKLDSLKMTPVHNESNDREFLEDHGIIRLTKK